MHKPPTSQRRQAAARPRIFHFEWDPFEDQVSYSPEAAALLGGDAATGSAGHAGRIARIHAEDRDAYLGLLEGLGPSHPSYQTAYRLQAPEGGLTVTEHGFARFDREGRLLCVHAVVSEQGAPAGRATPGVVHAAARDGRHRHEDLEALFHAAFDNAAVGVAHVGLDGRFLRLNRTLCEITGYDAPELAGCSSRTSPIRTTWRQTCARRGPCWPARSTTTAWRSAISARTAARSGSS